MLKALSIKNFVLIQELQMTPSAHFNTITGETGAGKSIILGAIDLLLGERADIKSLSNQNDKCVIEATFDIQKYNIKTLFEEQELDYQTETIIRREILNSGKSRAFINDTPVTLDVLKIVSSSLIDIHSQHDTLLLGSTDFQLKIVDAYAETTSLLDDYQSQYQHYKKLNKNLEKLKEIAQNQKKETDYKSFLFQELKEANLKAGEKKEAEQKLLLLDNATEIKLKIAQNIELLDEGEFSVIKNLSIVNSNFNSILKVAQNFEAYKQRIQAAYEDLKDLKKEIEKENDKIELDAELQTILKNRLDLIYKLEKKHGVDSVEDLIKIQFELGAELKTFENVDNEIIELEKEIFKTQKQITILAENISQKRKSVFESISETTRILLQNLGMPNAQFVVSQTETELSPIGIDKIQFLFTANKGQTPTVLKNNASGGEFSRLMFALKYLLAQKTAFPTVIFDEIDTGISGEIASKMGEMMKKMAENHQILTITHLHQIAAKGDMHFFVYKDETSDRTETSIKKLSQEERIIKIAEMIGGKNPSESAIANAKELMR